MLSGVILQGHSPEIVFGECRLNEFLFCQDVFHIARKNLIEFDFQNMFIQGLNGNTEVSPAEKVIKVIGHGDIFIKCDPDIGSFFYKGDPFIIDDDLRREAPVHDLYAELVHQRLVGLPEQVGHIA